MDVVSTGEGDASVLILPGADLPARFYLPLARALLARGLSSQIARLPGRDGVPALEPATWSALLDALPGPPRAVLGHSMGATLALLLAARRPPGLERLVLMEPAVFEARRIAAIAAARYVRRVVRGDREAFDNDGGGLRRVADPDRFPAEALAQYVETRRTADADYTAALFEALPDLYPLPFARVEARALVLRGEHAGRAGHFVTGRLAARLGAALLTVPGAAHFMANEADEVVADSVRCFLDS